MDNKVEHIKQNSENQLTDNKELWSLVEKNDFSKIIDWLSKKDIHENEMGEVLFSFARHAIKKRELSQARTILSFLAEALEDQSEAPPIIKLTGDTYFMEANYEKARFFYGKLPMIPVNIKLCLKTFIPEFDINGFFSLRDTILSRIENKNHGLVHSMINELLMQVTAQPEIYKAHKDLWNQNFYYLKTMPPFNKTTYIFDQNNFPKSLQLWEPQILKINNTVCIRDNNVWQKASLHKTPDIGTKQELETGGNIMVYCNSLKSFFSLIEKVKTNNPDFIKYECHVIIDFKTLESCLSVIDLCHLKNCNFFIRFIDSNHIRTQLQYFLIERKLPFINRAIYLSNTDQSFFSKQVIPTLKEFEKIIFQEIKHYEQQLLALFPESYYNSVIQKIKDGKKLKIIFFTSRYTSYMQYSTRDIAEGFKQLGHTTFIEIEDEDSGVSIRKDVCLKNLIDFKPDIIFAVNHFRYSYPWIPKSIPFVTWVQDVLPHIRNAKDPNLITPRDHILSFSKTEFPAFCKNHAVFKHSPITFLPIPVNNKIYYPLKKNKKKYDIVFITHIADSFDQAVLSKFQNNNIPVDADCSENTQFFTQLAKRMGQMSLKELCDTQFGNKATKKLAKKVCNDIAMSYSDDLLRHLQPTDQNGITPFCRDIRMLLKIKPVQFLLKNDVNIKVFGNNWNKLNGFENAAMGPIENGQPLNLLLNQSKIILNMSPFASWHMRAADAIGSGCFVLTFLDNHDDAPMTDLLKEKKEMVGFRNEKSLLRKTNYYLNRETERNTLAQKAYNKTYKLYSSKSHAGKIISIIEKMGFI